MSKNIDQVFIANPITANLSTDLMYFGRSPYAPNDDAAMTYANFAAQFSSGGGGSSPAQLIYVSNDGDDTTGNGTIEKPFATYAKAASIGAPLATITSQYTILAIGLFNITGDMTLFPFVNVMGISTNNYYPASAATQFIVTGQVTIDSTFNSISNATANISNCYMDATSGINATFTVYQNASLIFNNVNFVTGIGITIVGSDTTAPENVVFQNCSYNNGVIYVITHVNFYLINVDLTYANVSLSSTSTTLGYRWGIRNCFSTNNYPAAILISDSGNMASQATLSGNVLYQVPLIVDAAATLIIDALTDNIQFTNGANFESSIILASRSDNITSVNVTPQGYIPIAASLQYPINSTSGYLEGIGNTIAVVTGNNGSGGGLYTMIDTGAADAYVGTYALAVMQTITPYVGMRIDLLVANSNTGGACTIDPNGTGAVSIVLKGGANPTALALLAGYFAQLIWTGSAYQLLNPA